MIVASGGPIAGTFTTSNADGETTAADSLPTASMVLDGDDAAGTVTITDKTGGRYKFAATGPSATAGQVVEVLAAATIDGTAQTVVVYRAVVQPSVAVADKTGFSLAASGLDAVTVVEPAGEPIYSTSSIRQAIAALLAPLINKKTFNKSTGVMTVRNNADDASLWTTTATDDGTTRTIGKAT